MTATNKMRLVVYICAFVLPVFVFLAHAQSSNKEVGAVLKESFETKSVDTGSIHLNQRFEELKAFYASRSFKPIWVRDGGPKGKAKALLVELNRSVVHGLSPSMYRIEKLTTLMDATSPDELARLELLFSGALIDYGHNLSNGYVDSELAPNQVQIAPIIPSVTSVIDGAEKAGNLRTFVSSLLNVDDRYIRLIAKIAEIKRAQSSNLWPTISDETPELVLGDDHPEIVNVRNYLILMGDFLVAEFTKKTLFDRPLQQAVLSFQSRHGIEQSGELDRETLEQLAQPVSETIDKISINLERRRWQNKPIGETHFYFNLADNSGRLVIAGKKVREFQLIEQPNYEQMPSTFGSVTHMGLGNNNGLQIKVKSKEGDVDFSISLDEDLAELAKALGLNVGDLSQATDGLVPLKTPISAFTTYVTAWANKDGSIHFRPDKFSRDKTLKALLLKD